jgi:hypothetical protein
LPAFLLHRKILRNEQRHGSSSVREVGLSSLRLTGSGGRLANITAHLPARSASHGKNLLGRQTMGPTILKLSLYATLVWWTYTVETPCAFAQQPADSEPKLLAVAHYVRGGNSEQYLREGDPLTLQMHSVANVDAFVYVIYCDADGDRILLFPNSWERNNRVAASRRRQIPGTDSGIEFRIRQPFGSESLQIIASTSPLSELDEHVTERPGPLPVLSAEELDEWCKEWLANQSVEIQVNEFTTQPKHADASSTGPELVQ